MFRKTREIQFAAAAGRPAGTTMQVAPLIDIVFLLICFYLLVAQLISTQKDPTVELPEMASPAARPEDPAEFVINLRHDGTVTVEGRPVELRAVRAMLAEQLARAERTKQPLRVVVRADRRQRFGKLDELLKVCRQAGARQVVYRTVRKEQP